MNLKSLQLKDYRNVASLNIELQPGITVFFGENGQGKTNIVESVYVLANASSFRTNNCKDLIFHDKEKSEIVGLVEHTKNNRKYRISIKKEGKASFINDLPIIRFSEYVGQLRVVCFSPEDVSLFKDSPKERRHFLDLALSSLFPIYIRQLILFKKILEQRNELLKERQKIDMNLLSVFNDKLVEASYDVYKKRKWMIEKIQAFASRIISYLTCNENQIELVYKTWINEDDKDCYLKKGKEALLASQSKDFERFYTGVGIHKDDFLVYLNQSQVDLYASQGQQRLIALAMKLAVAEIIEKATKEKPIIILDDAFSELDKEKKEQLFRYMMTKEQVLITCTDYNNILPKKMDQFISVVKIEKGTIVERRKMNNG